MTATQTTKRISIALSLAILAASVPPVRLAVIDWIGASRLLPTLLPDMNSADGSTGAARFHSSVETADHAA